MSDAGFERHETSLSVIYYPEEYYTYGEVAVLIGVSASEVKELARNSKFSFKRNGTETKIGGMDIAGYLVNHGKPGFERLRELGYKGPERDIALAIKRDSELFSSALSLDELTDMVLNYGLKTPGLNGDKRKSKLVLTAILAIAESGQNNFSGIYAYCRKRLPYYVDRTELSGILNKRLKREGLIGKTNGVYYLNT